MNTTERPADGRPGIDAPVVHVSHSHEETVRLAREFARLLRPGHWVGLRGSLGAGKSVFARAVAEEWGVTAAMPSPSYTLMNAHQGRCMIYHIDLYRIGSPDELDFAGLTQYFDGEGICLVEWPDKARALWPHTGWLVSIEVSGPTERRIMIEPFTRSESERQ